VRIAAALAAAVVVLGGAGPAAGSNGEWKRISCTSGAIDHAQLSDAGQVLTLEWHLDCADSSDMPATFGYARYAADGKGETPGDGMRGYGPKAPTLYSRTALLSTGIAAICVVTDYDVKVACVKIDRDQPPATGSVRPLPIDDPLVVAKPAFAIRDGTSSPACGGCW
jgi:hypothetical protein